MRKSLFSALFMLVALVLCCNPIYAASKSKSKTESSKTVSSQNVVRSASNKAPVTVVKSTKPKVVTKVPAKQSATIKFGGKDYVRHNSKYYIQNGLKLQLVPPPFGLRVYSLPAAFTSFVFNSAMFYIADGMIYRSVANSASGSEYEVVAPEIGMVVPQIPDVNVSQVLVDGQTLFMFDSYLYKQIPTATGLQYEVVGMLSN